MSKKITITNQETKEKFVLEYTRKTAAAIEANGFLVEEVEKKPNTMIPLLFSGAFLANHAKTGADVIERMYDNMKGEKSKLIVCLIEMYTETMSTLFEDNDQGNLAWEPSW